MGFDRGGRGFDRPKRFDSGPRKEHEEHDAVCADCGQACKVPFKPREDRPVYCRDCYSKHKKF